MLRTIPSSCRPSVTEDTSHCTVWQTLLHVSFPNNYYSAILLLLSHFEQFSRVNTIFVHEYQPWNGPLASGVPARSTQMRSMFECKTFLSCQTRNIDSKQFLFDDKLSKTLNFNHGSIKNNRGNKNYNYVRGPSNDDYKANSTTRPQTDVRFVRILSVWVAIWGRVRACPGMRWPCAQRAAASICPILSAYISLQVLKLFLSFIFGT